MEHAAIFWWTLVWMTIWGIVGALVTPRLYLARNLDLSRARLVGTGLGAAVGPIGLAPLWWKTPALTARWVALSLGAAVLLFAAAFAIADPGNVCVSDGSFIASQLANGMIMGSIYGLMALGLTLIFSILGVVSFAHGEFYMIGGMVTYFMTAVWLPAVHPIIAVAAACIVTFAIGALFERLFLTPMYSGAAERPGEYAILVTFGLGFVLQYLVQGLAGTSPVKAQRFFNFPSVQLPASDHPWLVNMSAGNLTLFDTISIANPRLVAALMSLAMLGLLLLFLYRTWTGKALRAVAQDRQAAAVAGINPDRMNMLAFGLGCMLAGLSGATLVQAFSWLPQVGMIPALRSFVIIVLGGLGSLPGAFLGGLILGIVEAAGTGCIPDPTRAAAYIPAYGMVILTLVLLLKPTGLFGKPQ
jgi:branched-chain amino acid transport system permease protein